jgi:hypothetical protein
VESGPAFRVTHSANLELDDVSTHAPVKATPVVRLEDTPGAVVRNSRAYAGTDVFLSAAEGELKGIALEGNLLTNAAMPTAEGAMPNARMPLRTRESCLVQFDIDPRHPTEAIDEAKVCLNLVAVELKRSPRTALALIGNSGTVDAAGRKVVNSAADASLRARNSRDYLIKKQGIDAARIQVYVGEPKLDGPEDIDRVEAQMVAGTVVEGNVETVLIPAGAEMKYTGLTPVP